ncbi:MAG: manganese efflux pump [Bacteroidaceae bacterium]|nr:manganese efflux pump [Bacteroidaceae bacterium]
MNTFEIWIIAVGLAMDCFAVSIASGIVLQRFRWSTMGIMAFLFGFFQGGMPILGWLCTNWFLHYTAEFDHWIAFFILLFLGVRMIWESFSNKEEAGFNPARLKTIFLLAIATSIDALVLGISFSCLGMKSIATLAYPVWVIAFVSFFFSFLGLTLGILFGKRFNFRADLLGGIILIGIGVKILLSHLCE